MKTIRHTAALSMAAFAVLGPLTATRAAQGDWTMYVGTYTGGASKGIYAFQFSTSTGTLTPIGLAVETSNPSFLAVHPNQRFLYAANENRSGTVSSFAIDPTTGSLTRLNSVSSKGSGPCHVSVDQTGTFLFVANYNDGIAAAYKIKPDGSLTEATATYQHAGRGATQRQAGPHAHMAAVSPDNRFVWVADLGTDRIVSYRIDAEKGIVPNDPPSVQLTSGSGPRHLVFRNDSRVAYVINELTATVTVLSYDAAKGIMTEVQTVSTLPAAYSGQKSCAEIRLHPSGKFLYASNRGHDSIAVYTVDAAKGTLTSVGHVPTGGKTPRGFAIDPTGRFLVAANQGSNSIVTFKIDQATGNLTRTGDTFEVGSPVDVLFAAPATRTSRGASAASPTPGPPSNVTNVHDAGA
jgi:6-phosphogluconolactonase